MTFAYDQRGSLVQEVDEADVDEDGTIDGRATHSFEYGGSSRRP